MSEHKNFPPIPTISEHDITLYLDDSRLHHPDMELREYSNKFGLEINNMVEKLINTLRDDKKLIIIAPSDPKKWRKMTQEQEEEYHKIMEEIENSSDRIVLVKHDENITFDHDVNNHVDRRNMKVLVVDNAQSHSHAVIIAHLHSKAHLIDKISNATIEDIETHSHAIQSGHGIRRSEMIVDSFEDRMPKLSPVMIRKQERSYNMPWQKHGKNRKKNR